MARHRQLKNAPVREALVDVQFQVPLSLGAIDQFITAQSSTYGAQQNIWEAFFSLEDGPGKPDSTRTAVGRRVESKNGQFVLQARVSGFTLSRLSPYGKWDDLRSEGERLWTAFRSHVGEFVVSRVAVRYVNEIKLQLPFSDFGAYFVSPPLVPPSLPQAISGFLTRVVIPDPDADCVAIVTQALESPPNEGPSGSSVTVLLDIDVFRLCRCSSESNVIWQALEALREQKNKMFFEHLTEKTMEMYE